MKLKELRRSRPVCAKQDSPKPTSNSMIQREFITAREIEGVMGWSYRTMYRRMRCPKNPFPVAVIKRVGAPSLFDYAEFCAWKERERALTSSASNAVQDGGQ